TWQHPGTGVAVSPDDILAWDTPDHGGTWGYNEAAWYAPVSFRHKYVWTTPGGSGSMTVRVVGTDGAPISGATVLVNDDMVGGTDGSGQLHLPARPAGNYYVAAQLNACTSSGGVSLPPAPPPPALDAVPNLPACTSVGGTNAQACKYPMYPGDQRCPVGWLDVQNYPAPSNQCALDPSGATVQVASGSGGTNTVAQYLCACVAPPPSCTQLHPLESGGGPTRVTAGRDDLVTIRLCTGGLLWSGGHEVPQSCPQSCSNNADCDTGLLCQGNLCIPGPRKVAIDKTSLDIQTYGFSWFSPERTPFHPALNLICIPGANGSAGTQHYEYCADDGDNNKNTFVLDLQCMEGTDSGITVNGWAKLMDGCGGDAKDEKNTLPFTVGIAPFSHDNPTPVSYYGAPDNQGKTCYGDPGQCDENSAQFSLKFTSEPAQ
ncbi:MAG TPA: carboxypeptidase-like regulatory domain-containing protein, partial [Polyangiaceae bacterium]|nr:carboxypeptidase-like regulatory domain-containing protein [Polyangiaceae bacterium]